MPGAEGGDGRPSMRAQLAKIAASGQTQGSEGIVATDNEKDKAMIVDYSNNESQ